MEFHNWKSGNKDITENPKQYLEWATWLPKDMFEEVAANWFELIVDEEDLKDYPYIQIVT